MAVATRRRGVFGAPRRLARTDSHPGAGRTVHDQAIRESPDHPISPIAGTLGQPTACACPRMIETPDQASEACWRQQFAETPLTGPGRPLGGRRRRLRVLEGSQSPSCTAEWTTRPPAEPGSGTGYATLAFAAAQNSRLQLGTIVTGVTYRHPALLAKTVTTLDVLSRGRAFLGIGAA